jgi:hypothetical protein
MRRAVLPIVLLLPVACAQPQPSDPAAALQDALAAHQASLAGIGGLPAAAPAASRAGSATSAGMAAGGAAGGMAGGPATFAAPQAARPAPTGPTPNLAGQLVGQTPETVLAWLGPPRLRREEGAAEVWHYQASQCHLDIVLYHETVAGQAGGQPTLRVAFAAARSVGTVRRAEAACLRDIARGAARPGPSGTGELIQTG